VSNQKDLFWVSSTKKDLMKFPKAVQDEAIHGLGLAMERTSYHKAKPLKGFGGADVVELVLQDRAGTFRVVYTVKFEKAIYVLHAFQKKSKTGIKTDKKDIDLIHSRLRDALAHYQEKLKGKGK
jgi:phage-related protein